MNGDAIRKTGERLKDLTLAGSRYLLTEFSNTVSGRSFLECLERIKAFGLVPIVAHPERYSLMWDGIGAMREARSMGALGQISMGDLIGRNGGQSMTASFKMIEEGLCQFCATDAHTPDKLTSYMKAKDEVRRRYGEAAFDRLFRLNPEVVLKDRDASAILGAID
jgi:protein-tyrosine phosphatase